MNLEQFELPMNEATFKTSLIEAIKTQGMNLLDKNLVLFIRNQSNKISISSVKEIQDREECSQYIESLPEDSEFVSIFDNDRYSFIMGIYTKSYTQEVEIDLANQSVSTQFYKGHEMRELGLN